MALERYSERKLFPTVYLDCSEEDFLSFVTEAVIPEGRLDLPIGERLVHQDCVIYRVSNQRYSIHGTSNEDEYCSTLDVDLQKEVAELVDIASQHNPDLEFSYNLY